MRFPDFYGIDTPDQKELIASHKTVEEIRKFIGATSLHFLSLGGLIKSIGLPRNQLSLSLFNGVYPIDLKERKKEINYDVPKN
ncbi:MAG: amidophosphoribosyltransferase [Candidatus Nomurabacteria bacterium GW2011_GWA2_40_97]|nr:MAG: amidophosphoribosyltransferase [Candidatus Nomurabacteria bacterium GW2011_GWA2_40_97]